MMKVRMLQSMRGPGFALDPGMEHEGSAEEMARWCAKGIATPIQKRRRRATKPKAAEHAVNDEIRADDTAD